MGAATPAGQNSPAGRGFVGLKTAEYAGRNRRPCADCPFVAAEV
jgi:hypothetical protein